MPTTLFRLKVSADKKVDFERLTSQLLRDVAANEPSGIFEYRRAVDDPLTYVLFLSFDEEEAFQRYSTADYHRSASGQIMECLAEPPVTDQLERF